MSDAKQKPKTAEEWCALWAAKYRDWRGAQDGTTTAHCGPAPTAAGMVHAVMQQARLEGMREGFDTAARVCLAKSQIYPPSYQARRKVGRDCTAAIRARRDEVCGAESEEEG